MVVVNEWLSVQSRIVTEVCIKNKGSCLLSIDDTEAYLTVALFCISNYKEKAKSPLPNRLTQSWNFLLLSLTPSVYSYILEASKGLVAEKVLSKMVGGGDPPDFVMCVRDDRSDEDMFESILSTASGPFPSPNPVVFAYIVGRKTSKTKYYPDDATDLVRLQLVLLMHQVQSRGMLLNFSWLTNGHRTCSCRPLYTHHQLHQNPVSSVMAPSLFKANSICPQLSHSAGGEHYHVAEKVLSIMVERGDPPDFVMCVGDDRSDEDMFESIYQIQWYYLDDDATTYVVRLLTGCANASSPKLRHVVQIPVADFNTVSEPSLLSHGYFPVQSQFIHNSHIQLMENTTMLRRRVFQ